MNRNNLGKSIIGNNLMDSNSNNTKCLISLLGINKKSENQNLMQEQIISNKKVCKTMGELLKDMIKIDITINNNTMSQVRI